MKKTSIAMLLGLFALGCGEAPKPKTTATATTPDPAMMMMHKGPGGSTAAPAAEEKKPDAPAEGEKPAAETPASDPK